MQLRTTPELWSDIVRDAPDEPAYLEEQDDGWRPVPWDEAAERVDSLAQGLLARGVRHGDRVAVVSRTRLEWILLDWAIMSIGAVVVGLYPTNSAKECEYVLVEESDLEAVALTRSQSIAILRFVRLEDVDPVYFDRTYYLAPADGDAQRKPYVLLLRAMEDSGMAAVGKFVLWGKENLCLIRAQAGALLLETLFFAEDVRARDEIEEAVAETDVQEAEDRKSVV